jgi:hypothetical protein
MTQQTAVDSLIKKIESDTFCDDINGVNYWDKDTLIEFLKEAKAIETKQKHSMQIIKVIKNNRTHLYTISEWYSLWFLMFAVGTLVGILIVVIL